MNAGTFHALMRVRRRRLGKAGLKFTAAAANSYVRLLGSTYQATFPTLYYSTDGQEWKPYTFSGRNGKKITLSSVGDSVWLRGDNNRFSRSTEDYVYFNMSGSVKASGSVMSLVDSSGEAEGFRTSEGYDFYRLFYNCTALAQAPELPAKSVPPHGYRGMFNGCTGLASAPSLPATVLSTYSYVGMFQGCTGLVSATVPAAAFGEMSYASMFYGCTSLSLVQFGYQSIRQEYMLTHFYNWLSGVSATGTFIVPDGSDLSAWPRGASGVPVGWTLRHVTEGISEDAARHAALVHGDWPMCGAAPKTESEARHAALINQ